ncbi:MAG: DegT/DnrJ/EryC1/StrS family aminotransferase [Acidimicrobiales bacterium]
MSRPSIGQQEQYKALDAIRSGWISPHGPYVEEFEARFAELCGARHALAVSSGTAALHLALASLRLRPGAEVIVPTLTYVATANVVRYMGAEPVFVDVHAASWCIDAAKVADALTAKTRGIIAVDLYGHPADMTPLLALAAEHDIWVVEDAAEAVGATYAGRPVGNKATVSAFSFFGNKIVSCGQGGALTVNDDDTYARARRLRNQGRDGSGHPYEAAEVGFNYGLSNVSCAILCAQLDRLDEMLSARRAVIRYYESSLGRNEAVGLRPRPGNGDASAPWLAAATFGTGASPDLRDGLARSLDEAGVETRPFFHPLHLMEPYRSSLCAGPLDVSVRLAQSGLTLPTYVGLPLHDVDAVCRHVLHYLGRDTLGC